MKYAYIYAFGNREQVDFQVARIKDYANQNGFKILRKFNDYEGKSRGRGGREFRRMISIMKDRTVHYHYDEWFYTLLVFNLKALSQRFNDVLDLGLFDMGIHCVRTGKIYMLDHSSGMTTLQLRYEPSNWGQSFAPFGYGYTLNSGIVVGIVIDQRQAFIVRRIYNMYSTGLVSLRKITETINADPLMKSWETLSRSKIYRILKNPFYYKTITEDDKSRRVAYKPIVTRELFERVQEAFAVRNHNAS